MRFRRAGMSPSRLFPVSRRVLFFLAFFGSVVLSVKRTIAQEPAPAAPAEDASAKRDAATKPAQPPPPNDSQEVSSRDTPTTFKVRVNLVLVRVVIRDASGKVISGLKKENFQLFDNRKLQAISSFSLETPETH